MMQPTILLLKDGTEESQGRGQILSNINACSALVDTLKTTLGPRGSDKMIINGKDSVIISNDGATIMKQLDIVHPAAKSLVDVSLSQDAEVGDGTTSVVVFAGELLKQAKPFVEDGLHTQSIIKGYRKACDLARAKVRELAVPVNTGTDAEKRKMLENCAGTALNSKLVSSHKDQFAKMVVDAVLHLDEDDLSLNMIGIKKESGGSLGESYLVDGVAFKKTFSYAGFEQQPKKIPNPNIVCLNIELELKSEKDNAEIKIDNPEQYQSIVDAEWKIIYEKLDKIVKSGANVILSRLAIGDLATQYFADRGLFCAGRVTDDDLRRVCKATGCQVQTSVNDLIPSIIGKCGLFEERQVGGSRYNFFLEAPAGKTATILLRGGGDHFIDEAERSIHDAIMITRRAKKHDSVVAGGGAVEMEVSKYLREYSRTIAGKQQMVVGAFAKALEVIPRQLADNAGFDSTDTLNKLRQRHGQANGKWFGVDINNDGICDTFETFVWEPALVRLNCFEAATEAACLILSVDETVKNAQAEKPQAGPNMGRGMPQGMAGRGVKAMRGRG